MINKFIIIILLLQVFISNSLAHETEEPSIKQGFVYLNTVDPSIVTRIKYADSENLTGTKVLGCFGADPVVTQEAAEALREVQADLAMHGFSLVVYNAYYPNKTYLQLASWSADQKEDETSKDKYYPNLPKTKLVSLSYITDKIGHTRGSTVDVTMIILNGKLKSSCILEKRSYKNTKNLIYLSDGTVDMGSSYDCFDEISRHDCEHISDQAKANRKLLKETMQNHGFIANPEVWWQYSLAREPYIDSNFDFDV